MECGNVAKYSKAPGCSTVDEVASSNRMSDGSIDHSRTPLHAPY